MTWRTFRHGILIRIYSPIVGFNYCRQFHYITLIHIVRSVPAALR